MAQEAVVSQVPQNPVDTPPEGKLLGDTSDLEAEEGMLRDLAASLEEGSDSSEPSAPQVSSDVTPEPSQEISPETPEETEPPQQVGSAWEIVRAQEKKNREERQAIRAEMQELQQLRAEREKLGQSNADLAKMLQDNPLGVLAKFGHDFRQLAQQVIDNGGKLPEAPAEVDQVKPKSEVELLREQVAALSNHVQTQQVQAQVSAYEGQVRKLLADEKYALLATKSDALETVMALTDMVAVKHKKLLTPEEAIGIIDAGWRSELDQLRSSSAVRQYLAAAQQNVAVEPTVPAAPGQNGTVPALTNKATNAPRAPRSPVRFEEDELLAAAAKLVTQDDWALIGDK